MKRLLTFLAVLVLAVGTGFAARTYLASPVRIAGSSMENTLLSGDVALVTRFHPLFKEPARGDVVQCTFPSRDATYIKRLIGLPGDVIECSGGILTINSRPVSEPYAASPTGDFRVELGMNEYFVLGDNRAKSYDSRAEDMGCISRQDLLGRVQWILWPLNRFGPVQ